MQQRKAQYEIYSSMLDQQVKAARGFFSRFLPKNASDRDFTAIMFQQTPQLAQSLNLHIFAAEHFWIRTGANAIFPESAEVLDNLLRARFQMDAAEGFTLPFESFMLSVPQGYAVDGVKIPSFIVSCFPYQKMAETVIGPFLQYAGFKKPVAVSLDETSEDDVAIALCYKDPTSKTAYARTLVSVSQIPSILANTSNSELSDELGEYSEYLDVVGLSEYDLKIQRIMLRLVAAIGIYNMATEGKRLLPGLPGTQEPKIIGKAPSGGFKFSTLTNSFPPLREGSAPADAYYRTWFFRQLRADRYYKGEYSSYAKGSRYVFVSDSIVGQKVESYTQKFED